MAMQNLNTDVNGNLYILTKDGAGNLINSTANALNVYVTGGSSSGSLVDKTTFVYGTGTQMPVGGVYQDTAASLTAGQSGVFRLTANRGLHINLRNAAGSEIGIAGSTVYTTPQDASGNIGVFTAGGAQTVSVTTALPTGTNTIGSVNQGTSPWVTADTNSALLNAKASPATANMTQPVISTTSVSILAANTARKGLVLYNANTVPVFVAFAATATAAAFTLALFPNSFEEVNLGTYTGAISAITAVVATGKLMVTELV